MPRRGSLPRWVGRIASTCRLIASHNYSSLPGIEPVAAVIEPVIRIRADRSDTVILGVAVAVGDVQATGMRHGVRRGIGRVGGIPPPIRQVPQHGPAAGLSQDGEALVAHEDPVAELAVRYGLPAIAVSRAL